jgi:hypothetical protein
MAITRTQQARQMYKKGSKKPVVQGGVDNYLGDQPQVVVPRNWQSGPDKPPTELAYITEAEKKLLLKEDIHGSLKKGPNEGPAGIMSLDSFGDIDDSGQDVGMAGGDVSRAESGDFSGIPSDRQEQAKDIRAGFVAAGGQETKEEKKDKEFQKKKKEIKKTFSPLSRYNRQKKRDYIDYLKKRIRNKINKGLIDFQDEYGQIEGLTDFDDLQSYIDQVASVTDYTKGNPNKYKDIYDPDGLYAKGKKIPDFPSMDLPGGLGIVQDIFKGPVTKEKLNELLGQVTDLTALETGPLKNLQDTNINELMETYEPNRFKLQNPEPDGGPDQQMDPCKGPNPPAYCFVDPPSDPTDPSTPSTGVFAGIAPRFAGSIFDFDALRAGAMDGGIMNNKVMGGMADGNIDEAGRQMYFLGKLVKKATRAVKKVVKSPFGKAALLGAGAYFMPGFGIKATGGFSNFMKPGGFLSKILTKGGNKALSFDNLSLGKTTALGLGIPFALDALGIGKDDDDKMDLDEYYRTQGINIADIRNNPYNYLADRFRVADGGRINYQEGGDAEPVAKKTMPLIDMDGQEKDYRETGGFVDMGRMERADDVPARLSKNEFVFTADAVRNAGEGDIDKGAEVMYNMMKNLEAGGEVSEESQGLEGAREMFKTSQRLEEVL